MVEGMLSRCGILVRIYCQTELPQSNYEKGICLELPISDEWYVFLSNIMDLNFVRYAMRRYNSSPN
jgi:hypothetical protein